MRMGEKEGRQGDGSGHGRVGEWVGGLKKYV